MRASFIAFCLVLAALVPREAFAQTLMQRGPPEHRLVHRNSLALRYNPIGVIYDGRFQYRRRLFLSESNALRDNFVSIGAAPGASPAFGRIGVIAEVQPLSVVTLWALYEVVGYFGSFDHLQSYASPNDEFDDDTIARSPGRSASGTQLILGANVQLKFSDIVVRTQMRFARANFNLRAGERAFYDPFYDVLAPDRGFFFTNDADVLYQAPFGLLAGARYTVTKPLYRDRHYADGEARDHSNRSHRIGPLLGYAVRQGDGNAFNVLLFATAQWWLVHRYRTGENTSQALPLLAIGVQTTGDLIPIPPVAESAEPATEVEEEEAIPEASASDAGEVEAIPEAGDDPAL